MTRSTVGEQTPGQLLQAVRGRMLSRRRLEGLGWALTDGVALLGVQSLVHALYPAWSWPQALALAGAGALLTLTVLELRARPVTLADSARLTDRQLELHDLLGTAQALPVAPAAPLQAAMWTRVQGQADAAARQIRAGQLTLPRTYPPLRWPLALAAGLLLIWLLPVPRAAEQARAVPAAPPPATTPKGQAATGTTVSPDPVPVTAGTPAQHPAGAAPGASPTAPRGPALDGAAVAPGAADTAGRSGTAAGAGVLREARNTLVPEARGAASTATGQGRVKDTPFGSREGGSFANEASPDNPKALAAAPYDPSGPGSGVVKQKSSGPTGLRQASGGRGVESDGDDRCVQGCLTNNDMNRNDQARSAAPKPKGGSTPSGTSDSGGQAAGNSSSVGLGSAQARPLDVTFRRQLLGSVTGNAERVQVLAAPDSGPPDSGPGVASGRAQAGTWVRQPERLSPADSVPDDAQAAVLTYFRRTP